MMCPTCRDMGWFHGRSGCSRPQRLSVLLSVCLCVCVCVHECVQMCVCVYACVHVHTRVCVLACTPAARTPTVCGSSTVASIAQGRSWVLWACWGPNSALRGARRPAGLGPQLGEGGVTRGLLRSPAYPPAVGSLTFPSCIVFFHFMEFPVLCCLLPKV